MNLTDQTNSEIPINGGDISSLTGPGYTKRYFGKSDDSFISAQQVDPSPRTVQLNPNQSESGTLETIESSRTKKVPGYGHGNAQNRHIPFGANTSEKHLVKNQSNFSNKLGFSSYLDKQDSNQEFSTSINFNGSLREKGSKVIEDNSYAPSMGKLLNSRFGVEPMAQEVDYDDQKNSHVNKRRDYLTSTIVRAAGAKKDHGTNKGQRNYMNLEDEQDVEYNNNNNKCGLAPITENSISEPNLRSQKKLEETVHTQDRDVHNILEEEEEEEHKEQIRIPMVPPMEVMDNRDTSMILVADQTPIHVVNNQVQSPSAAEAPNVNNNQQQNTGITLSDTDLERFYKPEVNIYLTKVIGLFVTMILISLVGLLIVNYGVGGQLILMLGSLYLLYLILLDTFWTRKVLGDIWLESDQIFLTIDAIGASISLCWFSLRLSHLLPISIIICIPILITTLVYALFGSAQRKEKLRCILERLSYVLQSLLIALKLDDYLPLRWKYVFLLSFVYFGLRSFYCIKHSLPFLKLLWSVAVTRREVRTPETNLKLIGFFWYSAYHGLNIIGALCFIGIALAIGPEGDIDLLATTICFSLGFNVFLTLYTLVAWKRLTQFITKFRMIESLRVRFEMNNVPKNKRTVNFQVEKKESYFVMHSSTYFLPLQQSFMMKGKEGLKTIKKIFGRFKPIKSKFIERSEEPKNNRAEKSADVHALKLYKEALDRSATKIKAPKFKGQLPPKRNLANAFTSRVQTKEREETIANDETANCKKMVFSFDDLDGIKDIHTQGIPHTSRDEELLCYLCYSCAPDAILISCGHGGICYECATALVHKKNECMECRKKVEAIVKIDPNPKFKNIIKGVEINKIVSINE